MFFHLGPGQQVRWGGQPPPIRTAGGLKAIPSAALSPCWPDFFFVLLIVNISGKQQSVVQD